MLPECLTFKNLIQFGIFGVETDNESTENHKRIGWGLEGSQYLGTARRIIFENNQ